MSRGFDGTPKGDLNSARRKKDRRVAAAEAQRERSRRLRVTERKHTRGFLRPAVGIARGSAKDLGWKVRVERTGVAGRRALVRWTEAVVQLDPVDISIRVSLGDKRGSGAASTIRVHAGRKLVRTCPTELLQSGDGRAFVTWLSESLEVAAKRVSASATI